VVPLADNVDNIFLQSLHLELVGQEAKVEQCANVFLRSGAADEMGVEPANEHLKGTVIIFVRKAIGFVAVRLRGCRVVIEVARKEG
jgi:hypothetical protein